MMKFSAISLISAMPSAESCQPVGAVSKPVLRLAQASALLTSRDFTAEDVQAMLYQAFGMDDTD